MCGITAVINKHNGPADQDILRKMNDRIIHRGPDGEGYYYGEGFALGHRRLKITDLTEHAAQPMINNGYVLIFNGEIYNYKELKKILSAKGFQFSSHSDTEVILASYQHWGKKCVDHFNGMWAFIIYDPHQNILFCSRDRFGIKPFCYFETADSIYIGSEIKQFLDVPGFVPKMNNHIAFHYLYHGNINGVEQSFFQEVKFLSAGTNMIFDLASKSCRQEKWYSLENHQVSNHLTYKEACTEFRKIFESSIFLYTRSEVDLGTALSGGLDSSSIACMYKYLSPPGTSLNTISTCFHQEPHNEIQYIDEVSEYIGEKGNKVFPDITEMLSNNLLEKITYHQDQPILGGSFFSEYKLNEKAGDLGLKVLLSGQGADEYLAGYHYFHYFNVMNRVQNFQLKHVAHESRQYSKINDLPKFNLIKNLGYSLLSNSYQTVKNKISKNGLNHPLFESPWLAETFEIQTLNPVISMTGNFDLNYLSRKALNSFSLPHQLHSEDRHSMMFSVESRLPFLDHRLVEFSLQLPDEFKLKGGVTKRVMRDGLKGILPEKIRNRHNKLGFPGPEDNLFGQKNPVIKKQLEALSEQFPQIFSNDLSSQYENQVLQKTLNRQLIFRALSFYNWAKAFGIKS